MCESNKTESNYYLIESDWKVEVLKVRKNKSKVKITSIIKSELLVTKK